MPDQDEFRPQRDPAFAGFDKRLAVIEATRLLEAKADDARSRTIDKSFEVLGSKLDRILDGQNEPSATPAGRVILAELADQRLELAEAKSAVGEFRSFRDEIRGSVKTIRGLVIALGGVSSLLAIIAFVAAVAKPHGS